MDLTRFDWAMAKNIISGVENFSQKFSRMDL